MLLVVRTAEDSVARVAVGQYVIYRGDAFASTEG